jgi:hypothetical protein
MKLLVHASGYLLTAWKNDQQEIRCTLNPRCGGTPNCHWSPSSKDFAAVGLASGGSSPAASIDDLLKVISQQGVESIEELRILGHANETVFSLAGEIKNDDVYFNQEKALIGPSQTFEKAMPKFRELQDRFTANAKVILLGCNAGSGKEALMSLVSHAFLRTVAGFKEEIKYNFEWAPTGPAVRDRTGTVICNQIAPRSTVTRRGKMMYSTHGNLMGDVFGQTSVLGLYQTNAWNLTPDASANDGDIFIAVRRTDPGMAAIELAWRIMRDFFGNQPYVSGTSPFKVS